MAMDDTNGVTFGQVSHLAVLLRTGEFSLSDFISLKGRPSRKHWCCGLMIDDFVLLEKVSSEVLSHADTLGTQKLKVVRQAYEEMGLPRHPDKAVSGELAGEFWGGQLDGQQGTVRPNLKRLVPLVLIQIV